MNKHDKQLNRSGLSALFVIVAPAVLFATPASADTYVIGNTEPAGQTDGSTATQNYSTQVRVTVPASGTPVIIIPATDPVGPNVVIDGGTIVNVGTGLTTVIPAAATTAPVQVPAETITDSPDNANDTVESAAQKEIPDNNFLPWLLGALGAAVLAGLAFLWYRNRHWIHYLETDDNDVATYSAHVRTPLGHFDNYFHTQIRYFEKHKHGHLLDYLQQEHPDLKVGDQVKVNNFNITAKGDVGQKIKYLEVVQQTENEF